MMGGSYSGALAAWARQLYPGVFDIAWAASAPVRVRKAQLLPLLWPNFCFFFFFFFLQAVVDFTQYFEVTANSLGATCANSLRKASLQLQTLLATQSGRNTLESLFSTCESFTSNPLDLATFMESVADGISGVVQYSGDNVNYQPYAIPTLCQKLLANGVGLNPLIDVVMGAYFLFAE